MVAAAGGASAVTACSSSSDAGAGVDSGADCSIPSSVVYDCNPISGSDVVHDSGLADGAALCPPLPGVGGGTAFYPLGCGATLPEYGASTDTRTGCNGPITCTCLLGEKAPSFVCPD